MFSEITKNSKTAFPLSSFCSAVRCRALDSVAYRADHPSTIRPAVAPPPAHCARPPCRDEKNNTTFAPKSTPFRRKCTTFRHSLTRGRHDTRPRIRASVEVHFLPSPFTFTSTTLIYKRLCVNITPIFCFTEVKAKGVKPSHLSPYCPTIYAQWVKR